LRFTPSAGFFRLGDAPIFSVIDLATKEFVDSSTHLWLGEALLVHSQFLVNVLRQNSLDPLG
jgi:hypothetical protein